MLENAPNIPLAWRPDRELDKSIESIGSDCLPMQDCPRNAAASGAECLTDSKPRKRRGWFLDEAKIARRQAEIAAERERDTAEFLEWCERVGDRFGLCYFLGSHDIVKIGYSRQVNKRVSTIRDSSGMIKLRLLATAPGGRSREGYYHHIFRAHAIGNEWFNRCPEIDAEIERLSA